MILAITNTIPDSGTPNPAQADRRDDIADRIARRTLAKRGSEYAGEVRRLLDAGMAVMQRCGTSSRPRVSDIVAEAGSSNEAFYRHFKSKDALVVALLEEGAQRLYGYLEHQMSKEKTPEGKVRRWVAGVLSQAMGEVAATTLAVTWNGGSLAEGLAAGRHFARAPLSVLLEGPFEELGSDDPELDASLAAHAVLSQLSDYLWQRTEPTRHDVDKISGFCLRAAARARIGGTRS